MAAESLLWAANAAGLIASAVPWRGGLRRLRHIAVLAPFAPPDAGDGGSAPSVLPSSISAPATANTRRPGFADRRIPGVRRVFAAYPGIGDAAPQFTA